MQALRSWSLKHRRLLDFAGYLVGLVATFAVMLWSIVLSAQIGSSAPMFMTAAALSAGGLLERSRRS